MSNEDSSLLTTDAMPVFKSADVFYIWFDHTPKRK